MVAKIKDIFSQFYKLSNLNKQKIFPNNLASKSATCKNDSKTSVFWNSIFVGQMKKITIFYAVITVAMLNKTSSDLFTITRYQFGNYPASIRNILK